MTGNDVDAEDAVSQTIAKAFEKWDSFDGRHPRSWLIQVLRNEWLQMLRKRRAQPEAPLEAVAEPADDFWMAVDERLEADLVHVALGELAEDYRAAVTLCDVEQLSYEEAAKALGVPIGTLQSRLFRGRKALRSRLVYLSREAASG